MDEKDIMAMMIALIIIIAGSWSLTNFLIWLITLCFHIQYDMLVGTGVWLILLLCSWFVKPSK